MIYIGLTHFVFFVLWNRKNKLCDSFIFTDSVNPKHQSHLPIMKQAKGKLHMIKPRLPKTGYVLSVANKVTRILSLQSAWICSVSGTLTRPIIAQVSKSYFYEIVAALHSFCYTIHAHKIPTAAFSPECEPDAITNTNSLSQRAERGGLWAYCVLIHIHGSAITGFSLAIAGWPG